MPKDARRSEPFAKRGQSYLRGLDYWPGPFLLDDDAVEAEFVVHCQSLHTQRRARIIDMMFCNGFSAEYIGRCFGISAESLDQWIRSAPPEVWERIDTDRKKRAATRTAMTNKRYAKNPGAKLVRIIGQRVWQVLRGRKPGSISDILPYTGQDLIAHLEELLLPGMTWENYGRQWHVDHKRPVSWFDWTRSDLENVIRECWALSNLQPLWGSDNVTKGNRYEHT